VGLIVATTPRCTCAPKRAAKRTVPRGTRPRAGRAPPAGTSFYDRLLPVSLGPVGRMPRVEGDLAYDPDRGYNFGVYLDDVRRNAVRVAKIIAEEPVAPDGTDGPLTYAAWAGAVTANDGTLDLDDVVVAAVRTGNDTEPHGVAYVLERHGLRPLRLGEFASGDLDAVVRWARSA
jgi:hypothetical protein